MAEPRRVLLIGASGAFGRRLAEGIAATTGFHLVLAGRDGGKLEALAGELALLAGAARVSVRRLDRDTLDAPTLAALGCFVVVDAAGPFQGGALRVAEAAIAAGCHSIDLADARDFVAAFPRLDAAAKAAGVVALTGASSTPALSHAALREITAGWQAIDDILVAISPGNRAPRGHSVMQAILSYVGRPVRVFRDGAWGTAPGWGLTGRRRMPGLGARWLSLAETPDLDLLVSAFAPRRSALFKAGLELSVLHLGLSALSWLARLRLVPRLDVLARPLRAMAGWFEGVGSDRGGMIVEARGVDGEGTAREACWHLVAEDGFGPFVPTLAALALLRRLDRGELVPGAGPAIGDCLRLADIAAEWARYPISSGCSTKARLPLFMRALGNRFALLPKPIADLHRAATTRHYDGRADVDGPETRVGRIVGRLIGLPDSGRDIPVHVTIEPSETGETWTRTFAGSRFRSRLSRADSVRRSVEERFGVLRFRLDLPVDGDGLAMSISALRCGIIPLPLFMSAHTAAREHVDTEGRFCFDVRIDLPLSGRLVHYRGWLAEKHCI